MKLIVNADDFGLSRGVNFGVLDAYQNGVVRSASLRAGGRAFGHAVRIARDNPGLGVGVQLTVTAGRPLTPGLKTLTDRNGDFLCLNALMDRLDRLDPAEIEREYTAQIERVISAGIWPTHLDSDDHTHLLEPVLPVFERLARRYALPARMRAGGPGAPQAAQIPSPDCLIDGFYGAELSDELLIELITQSLDYAVVEIMTHPAFVDECLLTLSPYTLPRARELAILCADTVLECVRRHRIELISYRELGGLAPRIRRPGVS